MFFYRTYNAENYASGDLDMVSFLTLSSRVCFDSFVYNTLSRIRGGAVSELTVVRSLSQAVSPQ